MTMSNNNNNGHHHNQHGDTTLTKVFVGGLAWETLKDAMHDHFNKYGEILEAVIISDKISGRSKGYGFVTFKEPEAAKKACEDPTPIINGRRANCNLAALGARRPPRSSSTTPPLQQRQPASNGAGGANALREPTSGAAQVQWYYSAAGSPHSPTTPFQAHQQHQALPFYPGYTPAYITAHDHSGYNHMYTGGQAILAGANTMMAMYPYYPYAHHHHQHQHQQAAMGLPAAHFFPPSSSSPTPITASSPIISKPTIALCTPPPTVCLTVE